jgi:uncharacterized membrane protein YphA (DoxX/SURF4 family)
MWNGLERDLNAIPEGSKKRPLPIGQLGRSWLDSESIDGVLPWFHMLVGSLLIVGLFTRLAAVAGAAFVASVVLAQFPGSPGAAPTWFQAIEVLALVHLAAIGAGQFGGLDSGLCALSKKCCRSKTRNVKR